jgi:4-amino-4-deoxy-L-arabinose transferase-like glycosyltransferase
VQQVQRNDPCPCGSGKKYKKCCMNASKENALLGNLSAKSRNVYFVLAALFFLSVFLRFYGFQQPHGLTFDEGLYSELIAGQLKEDPANYSTQRAYQIQTAKGEKIPEYLDRPLFKHPPLYNYLIALNYKISGSSNLAAVSVSILFGSLLILIVFLLGRELYDDRVGLLAAFFLCIDPIHWICSEKIWMETTMVFFMALAILLFVLGQKQARYLPLSGISIGLAMLTKYPGVLSLFIIISYVVVMERSMIKQKGFWALCLLSFIVFLPWIIWNWRVYGNFLDPFISVHGLSGTISRSVRSLSEYKGLLAAIFLAGGIAVLVRKKVTYPSKKITQGLYILFALALISIPFLRGMIFEAFTWKGAILSGWSNPFRAEPWYFYLTRLSELSPLYLFSFLSIVLLLGRNKGDRLLLLSACWILGAFIVLGNYQSRYILPAVPFLIILSTRFQILVYDELSQKGRGAEGSSGSGIFRALLKAAFMSIALYFTIKTLRTDWLLAIGPDFGYF